MWHPLVFACDFSIRALKSYTDSKLPPLYPIVIPTTTHNSLFFAGQGYHILTSVTYLNTKRMWYLIRGCRNFLATHQNTTGKSRHQESLLMTVCQWQQSAVLNNAYIEYEITMETRSSMHPHEISIACSTSRKVLFPCRPCRDAEVRRGHVSPACQFLSSHVIPTFSAKHVPHSKTCGHAMSQMTAYASVSRLLAISTFH